MWSAENEGFYYWNVFGNSNIFKIIHNFWGRTVTYGSSLVLILFINFLLEWNFYVQFRGRTNQFVLSFSCYKGVYIIHFTCIALPMIFPTFSLCTGCMIFKGRSCMITSCKDVLVFMYISSIFFYWGFSHYLK